MGPYFAPRDASTGSHLTVLEMVKRIVAKRHGPEWTEPLEVVEHVENGNVLDIEMRGGAPDPEAAVKAYDEAYNDLLTALHHGSLAAVVRSGQEWFDIMSGYWGTGAGYRAAREGRVIVEGPPWLEEWRFQVAPILVRSDHFEEWLTATSWRANESQGTSGAQANCQRWLIDLMRSGPPVKLRKEYMAEAQQLFERLSTRAFIRAWGNAAAEVANSNWSKPGPKSKRPIRFAKIIRGSD
jgi:hypothetical protein